MKCSLYLLRSPVCLRVNSDIIGQILDSFFCALSLLTHSSALIGLACLYFSVSVCACGTILSKKVLFLFLFCFVFLDSFSGLHKLESIVYIGH